MRHTFTVGRFALSVDVSSAPSTVLQRRPVTKIRRPLPGARDDWQWRVAAARGASTGWASLLLEPLAPRDSGGQQGRR